MNVNLCKILILSMLADDDEPLNLILNEAVVTENNREYIKQEFCNEIISQLEIKNSLKELLLNKMIILLNEQGEAPYNNDLNEILNSNTEWEFWFRITNVGRNLLKQNRLKYFNENP